MRIEPQWIPIEDELPDHNTNCVVGNIIKRDPINPILGGKLMYATYIDTDQETEQFADCLMKIKRVPMKGFLAFGQFTPTPAENFTHWWPIPKPFGQE